MVFFIVLYSISQMDKAKYIELARALQASFLDSRTSNSLLDTASRPAETRKPLPQTAADSLKAADQPNISGRERAELLNLEEIGRRLVRELQKSGLVNQVTVTLHERGLVVSFSDSVFFVRGLAVMKPESVKILDRIAPILDQLPNKIMVEGHTDDLPNTLPQYPTSWELSVARAVAVVRYLTEHGGLDPRRFASTGYGEWRPRYSNDSEANRARNRRVDIVLLSESFQRGERPVKVIAGAPAQGVGQAEIGRAGR